MHTPGRSPSRFSFHKSSSKATTDVSDVSQVSTYTDQTERGERKRHGRLSSAARGVVGVFGTCFVVSFKKKKEEEDDVYAFKEISVSSTSTATDRSGSLSIGSRKSNSYGNLINPNKKPGTMTFTVSELSKATGNFSPNNKIGQGGFGTVYKGKLKDGTLVAVKRAKKNIYDKHLSIEFQSEIQTLSTVEHLNLVRLLGFLEHDQERMLVVEYVPNGTLREHLDCLHGVVLDLATRLDIAIDVAHAVTYLHMYTDQPIIHRDIKSSNILLTENFRAKVADFGFSRLAPQDTGATHVSTQVKGTAGYLDPEYLKTYQLTHKSDVYSFGVLLVEIITGRRPIEQKRELRERITVRWALKKFLEGDAILSLDPKLNRSPAANLVVEKVLELAFQCSAPSRQDRPSMKRTAEILWNIRKDYREFLVSHGEGGQLLLPPPEKAVLEESTTDMKEVIDKIEALRF
uniref:non-specific serine/threonine protein kinase n=1 Tax=Wollemia nobilis TaxID=56998 RepID=A0A0C9SAE5_9CONI